MKEGGGWRKEEGGKRKGAKRMDAGLKTGSHSFKNSRIKLQPHSNVSHHAAWRSGQYKYHLKGFK